jgi:hypothetical protein
MDLDTPEMGEKKERPPGKGFICSWEPAPEGEGGWLAETSGGSILNPIKPALQAGQAGLKLSQPVHNRRHDSCRKGTKRIYCE